MRACLFCNARLNRANRSKEHVIPRWVSRSLDFEHGYTTAATLTFPNLPSAVNKRSDVFDEREQSTSTLVLGGVCTNCNSGWMSKLEVAARPILESLWGAYRPTILNRKQCAILARWTFKTAVVVNYASNYKKIIPRAQVRAFHDLQRLPENATVDFAFTRDSEIHWVLGGNKQFEVLSQNLIKVLRPSYLITLQFGNLLLRLAWTPAANVSAVEVRNAMCRVHPIEQAAILIQIGRRFLDRWQLHFKTTIFSETGVRPKGIEMPNGKARVDKPAFRDLRYLLEHDDNAS